MTVSLLDGIIWNIAENVMIYLKTGVHVDNHQRHDCAICFKNKNNKNKKEEDCIGCLSV